MGETLNGALLAVEGKHDGIVLTSSFMYQHELKSASAGELLMETGSGLSHIRHLKLLADLEKQDEVGQRGNFRGHDVIMSETLTQF